MKIGLLIQGINLTSTPRRNGYQDYPKHKLGDGNDHEPGGGGEVLPRQGVDPALAFSGIKPEPLEDKGYGPKGQHHLCEKCANDKRKDAIPRSFVASISVGV